MSEENGVPDQQEPQESVSLNERAEGYLEPVRSIFVRATPPWRPVRQRGSVPQPCGSSAWTACAGIPPRCAAASCGPAHCGLFASER